MNQEDRNALLSNVQMTNWELSFAVCSRYCSSINRMSEKVIPTTKCQNEESAKSISDKHPHTEHTATCKVAHGDVNARHALKCCQTQWSNGLEELALMFYYTFSKLMVTIVLCSKVLFDQEMIYERTIVLMSSKRSVPMA